MTVRGIDVRDDPKSNQILQRINFHMTLVLDSYHDDASQIYNHLDIVSRRRFAVSSISVPSLQLKDAKCDSAIKRNREAEAWATFPCIQDP